MSGALPKKPLFLQDQRISLLDLTDPAEQFRVLFGEKAGDDKPWAVQSRDSIATEAADANPPQRVALICDAGRGKTTNMEWLQAAIAGEPNAKQAPFLLRLDLDSHVAHLREIFDHRKDLLHWMASQVAIANKADDTTGAERGLRRLREHGRITILIDGLDHVLGDQVFVERLFALISSPAWEACPVWISGRPEAFRRQWHCYFRRPAWRVLRVSALAKPQIRCYMVWVTGHDWYSAFPRESSKLLATPRLLKLICKVLSDKVPDPPEDKQKRQEEVARLGMHTAAGVYYRAYFDVTDALDPDSQGLLAQGLRGVNKMAGRTIGKPNEKTMPGQVNRLGMVLGAVAFFILSSNTDQNALEPYTGGVEYDELLERVGPKVRGLGLRSLRQFKKDLDLLQQMNNQSLEFLIFNNDQSDRLLAFYDRTVLTFFAAYWVMKYGTEADKDIIDQWIIDRKGDRLSGFDEFWTFAAEMPDDALKQRRKADVDRWLAAFERCYTPPAELTGPHDWVQWHRRMVYHSFALMRNRSPRTIATWRERTPEQWAILKEIDIGWCEIEPGPCPFGAEPAENCKGRVIRIRRGFRMHRYPVLNRWYEAFDPRHRESRWKNKYHAIDHPLADVKGRFGEDWCPVVNVTWFDAWNFAMWYGENIFLPTEIQWEHACRTRSEQNYYFGNHEKDLADHAWFKGNSKDHTRPVPLEDSPNHRNRNGLYDMHGQVWEWCGNWIDEDEFARVLRGGSWSDDGKTCRSAARGRYQPDEGHLTWGFRLAAVSCIVGAKSSGSGGDEATSVEESE